MSLIIFIFILSILILVHEWGHFITAKKCGVKVEQFAIGFGPKLFGWVHDGTEFCLCAVLLGGFVKMAGDEREKCSGSSDEYFSKSAGQRAMIILMGPVVNLFLAFLCFWFVFMIGFPDLELSSQQVAPFVGQVLPQSPAEKAGMEKGDKILSVNGQPILHWSQLLDSVTNSTGNSLKLIIMRDNRAIPIVITPEDADHQDIFGHHHRTRHIGVGSMPIDNAKDIVITRYGFFESFGKAGEELWTITLKTYGALFDVVIGAISPKEAFGGPISMFFIIKSALTIGFSCVIYIVGFISASLGIFNLLPVIPLDGGHLFLIVLEKFRGRALSMKTDQIVVKTGFALILMLMIFVVYSDCDRFGLIDKMVKLFKGTGL